MNQRPLALITGASAGLGAAFAKAYAARGHDLALVARRRERLEALGEQMEKAHGIRRQVIACDLGSAEACAMILDALGDRAGSVDVLVNNAGFGVAEDFDAASWERQREFLMTLVVNACGLTHAIIPGMKARRSGAIINVASLAGFAPGVAGHSLYPAAKSFAIKFSEALHAELKDYGVKVTASCPGFTRTEFHLVNGTQAKMEALPSFLWQTAEAVVRGTLQANDRNRTIYVPGLHNKLAAWALHYLPHDLVGSIVRQGARSRRVAAPEALD
jgi:short-subunit dehydrogenase